MGLHKSVVNVVDILCKLCANTYSNVSDYETEILDSDSDVLPTTFCKLL
jgi:hypothetical protein